MLSGLPIKAKQVADHEMFFLAHPTHPIAQHLFFIRFTTSSFFLNITLTQYYNFEFILFNIFYVVV